jgi:hypothetical protein
MELREEYQVAKEIRTLHAYKPRETGHCARRGGIFALVQGVRDNGMKKPLKVTRRSEAESSKTRVPWLPALDLAWENHELGCLYWERMDQTVDEVTEAEFRDLIRSAKRAGGSDWVTHLLSARKTSYAGGMIPVFCRDVSMVSLPLESLSDRPFDRREVRVEVKLAWTVLDEVLDVSVGIVLRGSCFCYPLGTRLRVFQDSDQLQLHTLGEANYQIALGRTFHEATVEEVGEDGAYVMRRDAEENPNHFHPLPHNHEVRPTVRYPPGEKLWVLQRGQWRDATVNYVARGSKHMLDFGDGAVDGAGERSNEIAVDLNLFNHAVAELSASWWSTAYTQYATELRIFCAVVRGGSGEDFDILEVPIEVTPADAGRPLWDANVVPALFAPVSASPAAAAALEDAETPDSWADVLSAVLFRTCDRS